MRTWPLIINLQEGFSEDMVILAINGQEVFRAPNVTTSLLTGPAASITANVEEGPVEIEVRIPTKGMRESRILNVEKELYLGISIVENESLHGKIRFLVSEEAFGYL